MSGQTGDQTLYTLPVKDSYGSTQSQPAPPVEEMQLNERDYEILRECQLDSIKERCAPMAAVAAGLTHFAVRSGKLAPHPVYGSLFKVTAAAVMGFVFGKMAYIPVCREKFRADPRSAMGQKIREKEGGYVADPVLQPKTHVDPGVADGPRAPSYADLRTRNRLGLDPVPRAPVQNPADSYEEPENSSQQRPGGAADFGYGAPRENYGEPTDQPASMRRRKRRNAYGDELEDV